MILAEPPPFSPASVFAIRRERPAKPDDFFRGYHELSRRSVWSRLPERAVKYADAYVALAECVDLDVNARRITHLSVVEVIAGKVVVE